MTCLICIHFMHIMQRIHDNYIIFPFFFCLLQMDLAERTDLKCDQNVNDPLSVPTVGDRLDTEWVNPSTYIELQSLDPYT
jgi:hypothetical protein